MGDGAVTAGVDVPLEVLPGHAELVYAGLQFLKIGFSFGAADDFSDLGEEDVHAADSAAVRVLLHVEGLDVLGEVYEDDGLLEVFFNQVTLVFALEVRAPVDGILKLDAVCDCLFKDFHGLRVCDLLEGDAKDALHALNEAFVVFLVQELEVVHAVVKGILHKVFHKFFGQGHVVIDVVEGHFGLNHPEFRKVTGSVGILCAESGAEGVDFTNCGGSKLTFQLAGNGEGGLLAEEVLGEVNVALLVQGDVLQVHGGYLEHVSCAFGIGFRDERGMEIHEALFIEELVDGKGHGVADAENCAEGVGPEAHVGYAAEVLKGGVLFLEGEAHGVAVSKDLDFRSLDFHGLAAAHGLYQLSFYGQGCTGGDALDEFFVKELRICYNLDIVDGGAVVEGDELHLFVSSLSAYPSFGKHFHARLHLEQSLDFSSFGAFHIIFDTIMQR